MDCAADRIVPRSILLTTMYGAVHVQYLVASSTSNNSVRAVSEKTFVMYSEKIRRPGFLGVPKNEVDDMSGS